MQNDCYRIFQNINVFKNHLIIDHSEDNQKSLNVLRISAVDIPAPSDNSNRNFDLTSDSLESEQKFINDFDNTEQNLIDLKKQLQHEVAKFVSSFYNELSMNRTHVQTIVDSTRSHLSTK